VSEVKAAGTRDAEIVRLRPADACILGVDAKAKTVDEFIDTYQLDVYQIAYFGTGEQGFSHAQGRRFMVAKLAVSLLAIAVSVPWWRALGLVR
jgi:hypothetical protein